MNCQNLGCLFEGLSLADACSPRRGASHVYGILYNPNKTYQYPLLTMLFSRMFASTLVVSWKYCLSQQALPTGPTWYDSPCLLRCYLSNP